LAITFVLDMLEGQSRAL